MDKAIGHRECSLFPLFEISGGAYDERSLKSLKKANDEIAIPKTLAKSDNISNGELATGKQIVTPWLLIVSSSAARSCRVIKKSATRSELVIKSIVGRSPFMSGFAYEI